MASATRTGRVCQRWWKTDGRVAAFSFEDRPHQRQRLSRRVGFCPDGDLIYGACRRWEIRNGFSGRRVRELVPRIVNEFTDASGIFHWPRSWNFSIEGGTPRVENWLALSETLAHPLNASWTAAGGLAVKMRAVHSAPSPATIWLGTIDSRDFNVTTAYLNQPLRLPNAHMEFAQSQRTLTLIAANAFGAMWRGTVVRKNADARWTFDVSADHLDVAELDRWLGPRARPGLLARFTGAGESTADISRRDAAVARIAARGRLRASEIVLAPLRFEKFDGQAELAGRTITI